MAHFDSDSRYDGQILSNISNRSGCQIVKDVNSSRQLHFFPIVPGNLRESDGESRSEVRTLFYYSEGQRCY